MNAYLGYGVHVEHDPELNQVMLKVDRSEGTHWIALTQEEIDALNQFASQCPPLTGFG